ncbi:ankyrin repeat and SOCS box protein 18 [Dasypus novemcinctus]|uniref:ankyrin repeat and SOCS box protein 18 n=1 Tax=Dasypus novemcinctus TaxID=9361 RepID=UPI00265D6478|nr:ankyrin repeat and SOCS box protein 18 [Dasypus novemcinctus]
MSRSDRLPHHPLSSDLVRRLKAALDASDEGRVVELLCAGVAHVDAVIELSNDDWMKEPSAQLPPGMMVGDLDGLQVLMDQFFQDANVVFEIREDEMEWQVKSPATFGLSGLWTLEYKRELTTPLRIAAARGHTACVRHLLGRGADPDASPGGRGALHEACLGGHTACAHLLLQHRADPDLLSADGLAPLHLCRTPASLGCAQALLEHGASVQRAAGAGQDTPLHVAAQRALDEHARLYLGRGARVDARNGRGETALSAACGAARRPDEHARCLRLCALLLRHGAAADARDEDERSPLHKACGHAHHGLACLLLRHGADASALDYGGASPLARVLQAAPCAPPGAPSRCVQALLNHGSPTVWPDAFPKVLRTCASSPTVIEVLFNSYPQLHVSESWKEVIPEEVFQMHLPFYQSLFASAQPPRCLQHLCRCAIRKLFGKKCFCLVPLLPLPTSLQNYLLLEPQGVLH